MNQRELASVLFAVVGVLAMVSRIPEVIIHLGLLSEPALERGDSTGLSGNVPVIVIVGLILGMVLGGVLIVLRQRLADRLFPAGSERLLAEEAQAVALSVLGAYLVVQGIARVTWIGRFDWSAAVQLVLGIALFFGARGLSGLWRRVRGARPGAAA